MSEMVWRCAECGEWFATFYPYADHIATHDAVLRNSGPER